VVKGRFRMEFRDRHVWLEEGEFLVVARGVEHRPVADEEAHVLLFEPASTLNTGEVRSRIQDFMRKLFHLPHRVMSYFQHPSVQYAANMNM
jgi:uncharacterized protein (DUF2249 family)